MANITIRIVPTSGEPTTEKMETYTPVPLKAVLKRAGRDLSSFKAMVDGSIAGEGDMVKPDAVVVLTERVKGS